MAITSADFEFRKAVVNSDVSGNGGRMSTTEIVTDVKNNLYPDITQAQRTAGLTRYRKLFCLIANADDLSLQSAKAHLSRVSAGDDYHVIFEGTQTDTQGDISSPRQYGIATLATSPSAGGTSFDATLEDSSLSSVFQTGDSIWIGNESGGEYFDNVTIIVTGATVSVALDSGDSLASAYTSGDAYVASVLPASADIETSVDSFTDSSNIYDDTGHPVEAPNIGTVEDDWAITFTSATAFTVEGTNSGTLASGSTSGDYTATNPNGGSYFILRAAGWEGSPASGNTVSFSTHPAALPIWLKEVVPAGAASISLTTPEITVTGESS